MEDELWFAYLEQVAQQEKASAAEPADQQKVLAADAATQEKVLAVDAALVAKPEAPKPAPPSPFSCEELPSE
jgi:hypothetical protein